MRLVFILLFLFQVKAPFAQSKAIEDKTWKRAVLKTVRTSNFDYLEKVLLTRDAIVNLQLLEEQKAKLLMLYNSSFSSARDLFDKQMTTQRNIGLNNKKVIIIEMRILNEPGESKKQLFIQVVAARKKYIFRFPNCYIYNEKILTTGEVEVQLIPELSNGR